MELAYRATTLLVEDAEIQLAGESVQAAFVRISRHTSGSCRSYYPVNGAVMPKTPTGAYETSKSVGLEGTMVSIWWVVAAFVLGCNAGLLVFALMSMAARHDE
jgi:hypothetical protein